MASASKVIVARDKQDDCSYYVYGGLKVRMEPSVLPSESRLRGSSTAVNPPSTSATSVLALSRTSIPSAVFSLRDMTDESINEVLLDKLQSYAHKPNENIDILRAASARLHSRAASQDKNTRESTLTFLRSKKTQAILVLHTLLENVRDTVTATSVAGTIRECIAPKADKKDGKKKLKSSSSDLKKNHQSKGAGRIPVIKKLIELNATQSIVKLVLCLHNREIQPSELLLQELIGILGVLAQKDHKFSVKTRLLNGVKVFHHLLRTHYYNHKRILSPLLLITISLAKNVTTTNILVKDGITTTLDKALSSFGYTPNSKLKLLLNVFFILTKNSKFCSRMVKTGLVPQILKLFERWERYDGKMRIRICHFTLQTLGHLCNSRSGRHAICNGNGLALLYKFIQNCPDDAQHDPLLLKTCFIINACIERKELPVCTSKSPAQFTLPTVSGIDYNSSQNVIETDESGDESTDDYLDEDEENEKEEYVDEQPAPIQMQPMFLQQRDISELSMYNPNWCELSTSPGRLSQDRTEDEPNYTFKIAQNGPSITVTPIVNENSKSFHRLQRTSSLNIQDRRDDTRFCFGFNKKVINLKVFQDLSKTDNNRTAYCKIASRVRSVLPFVKVAYPDMDECSKLDIPEPLFNRDRKAYRTKLLSSLDRNMYPSNSMFNVVYDMDQLVASNPEKRKELSNWDEERVGLSECSATSLQFESRFESGNLRKAIQVGPREYDLVMMPDVNSNYHHNWFYFEVSNMDNLIQYTLNIINFDKPNSQFNFGMKPLLFSVKEAMTNKSKWVRAGEDICYFKNTYSPGRSSRKKKALHTVSFSIQFPHNLDVCYIAYHFPYTYSKLLFNIWQWSRSLLPSQIYLRVENLCNTLNNNETPVITVTSAENYDTKIQDREIIFLTSRIHPGETNSSWVMHGSLDFLLSDGLASDKLRSKHIIKVVPMLNPEGVINGCYRCGLSDEDLNRKWREPDPVLHPTIYHTKGLMDYSCRVLNKVPYVFCDYHGHSRRKNVFLFGCSMPKSWNQNDFEKERDGPMKTSDEQVLPKLLASIAPAFDFSQCSFVMEHSKETTARITVWREFNVTRSYTMESSYCGFDVGAYKGNHMNICHLEEMGGMFCAALVYLSDSSTWSKRFNIENIAVPDSMTESGEALDDSSDSSDSDCSDN